MGTARRAGLGPRKALLAGEDPEGAGFFLQQALEKFLKSYLIARGWQLVRTHSLVALLNEAVMRDTALAQFRPLCEEVTRYYLLERYPLPSATGPSSELVEAQLAQAMALVQRLR